MIFKSLLCLGIIGLAVGQAQAAFVGVYDYLSSQPTPFGPQTGAEPWTFHAGDQTGALMPVYTADTFGYPGPTYAQFGSAQATGLSPGGTAGVNEAPGIFVHTLNAGYTAAVYHATAAFTAEAITFTYELVGNGNLGNGIDLTLRTIVGGLATDWGTITITNVVSAQQSFDFGGAGLQFQLGDEIAVLFSSRGSYLYDHGWWDIGLTERPPTGGTSVPDTTSTLGLLLAAAGGGWLARRRRR